MNFNQQKFSFQTKKTDIILFQIHEKHKTNKDNNFEIRVWKNRSDIVYIYSAKDYDSAKYLYNSICDFETKIEG